MFLRHFIKNYTPKKDLFLAKVILVITSTKLNIVDRMGVFSLVTTIEYHCQKPTIIIKQKKSKVV